MRGRSVTNSHVGKGNRERIQMTGGGWKRPSGVGTVGNQGQTTHGEEKQDAEKLGGHGTEEVSGSLMEGRPEPRRGHFSSTPDSRRLPRMKTFAAPTRTPKEIPGKTGREPEPYEANQEQRHKRKSLSGRPGQRHKSGRPQRPAKGSSAHGAQDRKFIISSGENLQFHFPRRTYPPPSHSRHCLSSQLGAFSSSAFSSLTPLTSHFLDS